MTARRIGFLGTGHIAVPMARALASGGHDITVSQRNTAASAALAESHGVVVASNQEVLDRSDIVFLTLRPAVWADAVAGLNWRADHQIVSAMAGISIADIRQACVPVSDVSVMLPLGHIEHGGCPLPVTPADSPVVDLFGAENPIIQVAEESQLGAYFAASTMLTALLSSMMAATDWLKDEIGAEADAEAYITHLAASYLSALPEPLADTRAALASPNTLNRMMLEAVEAGGFDATVKTALSQIATRMRAKS